MAFFATPGEQISESPITPACAEHKKQKETWQQTHIYQCLIGISGGLNKRALAASTIECQSGDTIHRFVELHKNAEWFLKGVGGTGTQKGMVKAVTVLQDLRVAFLKLEPAVAEDATAVASDEEPDPMDALDEVVTHKPKAKSRPTEIKILQMPTRPSCAGASEATTTVVVYGKNAHRIPKNFPMFLRVDCIDWLLSYAADQLHCQGVDNLLGQMDDVLLANCAAVADLHVEWNFHAHEWQAYFVAGPFQGAERKFGIESLTPSIWAHLEDEVNFQKATRAQQKAVAKQMLVLWCNAICCSKSDDFETMGHPRKWL